MPTPSDEQAQISKALNNLAAAVQHLQVRYEAAQRANRRVHVGIFLLVLLLLGGGSYVAYSSVTDAINRLAPPKLAATDPEAAKAKKLELLNALPPSERETIELFEKHVGSLRTYLDLTPHFDAGATIALFLAQMSRSVQVMPAMYEQVSAMRHEMHVINEEMDSMNTKMSPLPAMARDVQGMNTKMDALPILATDVQGMHGQVAIMASGMDSTMGRAGRMMPWNW